MLTGRVPRHSHEIGAAVGSGAPTYSAKEGALYWDIVANTLYVNSDGGTTWVAVLTTQYGEIWVSANTVATTISVAGTFVQVTVFDTNGEASGATPDHTNDHITIGGDGTYLVTASFHLKSVGGGGADLAALQIRKNNGATTFSNLMAHRALAAGGGDTGSASISGLASLSAGDTLEVWLANEDSTGNILVEDATFTIVQVG